MPTKKKPDSEVSKKALRVRALRAQETPEQRSKRLAAMRERMRDRKRRRNRSRRAHMPPCVADAAQSGATILTQAELERPVYIVITPAGRRIETLEPDLA